MLNKGTVMKLELKVQRTILKELLISTNHQKSNGVMSTHYIADHMEQMVDEIKSLNNIGVTDNGKN